MEYKTIKTAVIKVGQKMEFDFGERNKKRSMPKAKTEATIIKFLNFLFRMHK